MEYAMMVTMGAVNQDTAVITTVHDCQVVDIPDQLVDDHDLMVRISFISPTVEPTVDYMKCNYPDFSNIQSCFSGRSFS